MKSVPDTFSFRLRRYGPVMAVAVAAIVASFFGFTLVLIWKGSNASLPFMVGVWTIVLFVSAIACDWRRRADKAGVHDLIIDDESKTITLPPIRSRRHAISVPISALSSITVKTTTSTNPDDDAPPSHVPLIAFRGEHGSAECEPLVDWLTEEDADALANWLTERLIR